MKYTFPMKYAFIMAMLAALLLGVSTSAHSLMLTSGSVLSDPAGVCKRFYTSERCFR